MPRRRKEDKNWAISVEALIIQLVALPGLLVLAITFRLDKNMTGFNSCINLSIKLVLGMVLQLLSCLLRFGRFNVKRRWDENSALYLVMTLAAVTAIQVIIPMLFDQLGDLFAVTIPQAYAFYIFAAVAEEAMFRGGIIGLIMIIMDIAIPSRSRARTPQDQFLASKAFKGCIAIAFSSLIFMLDHGVYYGNPANLVVVLFSGVILGISFIATDGNLLIPLLAHSVNNGLAAGSIAQTLK